QIGGEARHYIAALDAVTGDTTTWNPDATLSSSPWLSRGRPSSRVAPSTVGGATVYAGGQFTSIGGQSRYNVAALDAASGVARSWNPNSDGAVHAPCPL